ncbi:cysteine synthase [Pyrobaculum islandicum DSM 4184]|uniref:Cysteine synthase n=1 Tax=Pyrobaculum islandicum (strain DSM 4184 / JCM 9189 / GEO3) TaxID=384616 RepID=A1RVD0_PYRIL|nr:pyridoxal-phosphate dependent enzyme [Pyrobaculum islandicum]ABL88912.1 cysteine synthase [Pyrobaculum islandicum DSM 4184]
MVWLENIEFVKSDVFYKLSDLLSVAGDILRQGGVVKSIGVDDALRVVEGHEVFHALKLLGVRRVPISRGRSKEVYVPLETLGFYDDVACPGLRVFDNTVELLYKNWPTPLFKLRSLSRRGLTVWAKWEAYNPFSWSIKDRVGWYMFTKALEEGRVSQLLYEATSTNTGMTLAAMAAIHGVRARLYLPSTAQKSSDVWLKTLGAEVVRVSKPLTVDFVGDVEREAARDGAIHLNQFENDRNFEVHLKYTAKELDLQLRHTGVFPRAIIGGLGTSGHMSALSFYFKNRYRGSVKIYGVQPAVGHVIPGIRRIETGMKWVHLVELDGVVDITREDAVNAAIEVARKDGILIGLSSGAVASAFLKIADRLEEGHYILIFPDNGLKYAEIYSTYVKD